MPADLDPFTASLLGRPEPEVKAALLKRLSHDFEMQEEVEGTHLIEGVKVAVDFMLTAKAHLVAQGFTPDPVPLEVKQLSDQDNKSIRAAWQCITYAQSMFAGARPPFVVLFPPLKLFLKRGDRCEHALTLSSLLPKANVAQLHFHRDGQWEIYFAQNRYFREGQGVGPYAAQLAKRYVGAWK